MHDQRITAILSELRAASTTPEEATQNMIAIFANPQCTLTSLNLGLNGIGNEGAIALAIALEDPNCTLTSLDLYGNNIGPEGAIALANALKTNRTLTVLNLGWNNIGAEGVQTLTEALKDPRCTLTSLDLKMEQN